MRLRIPVCVLGCLETAENVNTWPLLFLLLRHLVCPLLASLGYLQTQDTEHLPECQAYLRMVRAALGHYCKYYV